MYLPNLSEVNFMKKNEIKNITLSAMFLGLGLVLPLLTGQIQVIGRMLLPMHIPVLLCGLICGWQYGLTIGFILPLMRSVIFSMPPMYPTAVAMAFELATYGFVVGFLFANAKWQCIKSLYRCLLTAMLLGRAVSGLANLILLGIKGNSYTLSAFIAGHFTTAVPGIILQLILIPSIMLLLNKTHLIPFKKNQKYETV